jgi:hypothetical protein
MSKGSVEFRQDISCQVYLNLMNLDIVPPPMYSMPDLWGVREYPCAAPGCRGLLAKAYVELIQQNQVNVGESTLGDL